MSIRYRKYQEKREGNKNYGKWYGRAVHLNNVSTKGQTLSWLVFITISWT